MNTGVTNPFNQGFDPNRISLMSLVTPVLPTVPVKISYWGKAIHSQTYLTGI